MEKSDNKFTVMKTVIPIILFVILGIFILQMFYEQTGGVSKIGKDGVEFYKKKQELVVSEGLDTLITESVNNDFRKAERIEPNFTSGQANPITRTYTFVDFDSGEPINNLNLACADIDLGFTTNKEGKIFLKKSIIDKFGQYNSIECNCINTLYSQKTILIGLSESQTFQLLKK